MTSASEEEERKGEIKEQEGSRGTMRKEEAQKQGNTGQREIKRNVCVRERDKEIKDWRRKKVDYSKRVTPCYSTFRGKCITFSFSLMACLDPLPSSHSPSFSLSHSNMHAHTHTQAVSLSNTKLAGATELTLTETYFLAHRSSIKSKCYDRPLSVYI